jgi:hypothetical protein
LTRHVRTEAGVRRYKKPIGTPLGGGEGRAIAKAVVRDAKKAAPSKPQERVNPANEFLGHPNAARSPEAAKAAREAGSSPLRPTRAAKVRSNEPRPPAPAERPRPVETISPRRPTVTTNGDQNLWQLDPKRLSEAINNPNISPERQKALRVELARRKAKAAQLLGEKKDALAFVDKNAEGFADPKKANALFRALYKISPALKPKLEGIRNSSTSRKLRDVKILKTLIESAIDAVVKSIVGTSIVAGAAAIGLHLLGG